MQSALIARKANGLNNIIERNKFNNGNILIVKIEFPFVNYLAEASSVICANFSLGTNRKALTFSVLKPITIEK